MQTQVSWLLATSEGVVLGESAETPMGDAIHLYDKVHVPIYIIENVAHFVDDHFSHDVQARVAHYDGTALRVP